MPHVQLDAETHERLSRLAGESGQSLAELFAKCLNFGLNAAKLQRGIDSFHTLTDQQRRELADRAGQFASGAQLLELDAEDGGYDWGPNGPPRGDL